MLTDPYARTSCGRKAECAVYLFLIVTKEIKRCLWYRMYGLIRFKFENKQILPYSVTD
jgi:hypothetical protein